MLHYNAQCGPNPIPHRLDPESLHSQHSHGQPETPVTCMIVFSGVSIFLILTLYYYPFAPLACQITGHPQGVTQLQRVGLGLVVSILIVTWAGAFERYRRNYAIKHGFEALFLLAMPNLSAYWLLIQYCLIGVAKVFCIASLLEFLYKEAPDTMRSLGSAYAAVAGGLGCFIASILNSIVNVVTGNDVEGKYSWLAQNVNYGLAYFYWLPAALSLIKIFMFLFFPKRYTYGEKKMVAMEVLTENTGN